MQDVSHQKVKTAVIAWARDYYQTRDIVAYVFDEEDDDPDRYIAVLAVRGRTGWRAAEAWLEDGRVVSINDLGEGVPSDNAVWPWPD
jgi:hypothetical protein